MVDDFAVLGMDHVGLTVRDMDRSIHFYRDLVGLELLVDYSMAQDPNRPGGLYHGTHTRRRLVMFATAGGPNLALNSHPGDDLEGVPILLDGAGINHVSLTVSDLAALTRRMEGAGVACPGPGWFIDPDGMLVQFEEPGHAAAGLAGLRARAAAEQGSEPEAVREAAPVTDPAPEQPADGVRVAFESLDFVYVPTEDVDAGIEHHVTSLGAELLWKVRAMGTTVAALRMGGTGPQVLLAEHLHGQAPILVYRVSDYDATVAGLRAAGLTGIEELQIPHGPCATFEVHHGSRCAVYQLTRPGMDAHFAGRLDP